MHSIKKKLNTQREIASDYYKQKVKRIKLGISSCCQKSINTM